MIAPISGARRLPDRVRVFPGALDGAVDVVGDKSLSHRCLMIGALAEEVVAVSGLAASGDVASTAAALRLLDARIELDPAADGSLSGRVHGGPHMRSPDGVSVGRRATPIMIDCGNSGTTLRLLAGIAAGIGRSVVLDGDHSLQRRPVDRVLEPLRAMGADVSAHDDRLPPLAIRPGRLQPITWRSPVASAQIKSAVILAGLGVAGPTTVVSPAPSRDHTERMLRHGGLGVVSSIGPDGSEMVTVHPGPIAFSAISAARDPSAAAFWHVAGAFGVGRITTPGLCLNEGRTGALDVLRALGVDVRLEDVGESSGEPVGTVVISSERANAALVAATSEPVQVAGTLVVRSIDELPILALAGALSWCGLEVRDAEELRVKESDRIHAIAEMFRALGMHLEERVDGFLIRGGQRPSGGSVHAGGDHRVAMTAAIAATLGTASVDIAGFRCVATSYPEFLDDLTALGGRWEPLDD